MINWKPLFKDGDRLIVLNLELTYLDIDLIYFSIPMSFVE